MYAASIPLGICFFATFNPPSGMSDAALFSWLLLFACGTRFAMTLFVIPHQSLVAELSDDYDQRTRLQSGRTVFAWLFGLLNALLAYTVFLKATDEYPYDPAGFPAFALWGAAVMVITTALSSVGTQRAALAAGLDPRDTKRVRMRDLYGEIREALRSSNYRTAITGGLLGAVTFGMTETLGTYMNLYFWGFKAQELAVFILVIALASLIVLAAAPRLASRFGKGRVATLAALIAGCVTPTMVALKIVGVLPPAGDPALLKLLCVAVFIGYSAVIVGFVMIGAMIADITDEHELRTGARQEGLLFAAMTLIAKAASGLAPLLAGIVIHLADFPEDARPGAVDPTAIRNLGVFAATFTLVVSILATLAYSRYRLTREGHNEILARLRRLRSAAA